MSNPVVIVGAGPAGVRAACALVAHGQQPIVLDEADAAGGQIYRQPPPELARSPRSLYGFEARKAIDLHRSFAMLSDNIDYRPGTLVWNVHGGQIFTYRKGAVDCIPYKALLLATGATDRVLPFPGWTLPGVYSLGGAQVALKHQGCAIGRRVIFAGSTPLLYLVAYQYMKAGGTVAAVLDTAPLAAKRTALARLVPFGPSLAKGLWFMVSLRAGGVPIFHGARMLQVDGGDYVTALSFRDGRGCRRQIECDAIAYGHGLRPESQLAELAGADFTFEPHFRQWLPKTDQDGRAADRLYLAGDGARIGGADAAEHGGELAALALVSDHGLGTPELARTALLRRKLARQHSFQVAMASAFPLPVDAAAGLPDETIVCRCEGISAGEIRHVVGGSLPADELNRAKAFSRVGMGRCQGRYCELAAAEIIAAANGRSITEVGRLRTQAPVKPIPAARYTQSFDAQ